MKRMNHWKPWRCLGALASLWACLTIWQSALTPLFCRPPAWAASLFFNAPLEGTTVHLPQLAVHVTQACSGMHFFVLLSGLLGWYVLRRKLSITSLLLVLPLAYIITLAANSLRVIFSVFARQLTLALLGETYLHVAHLAAGVLVFLPILLLMTLLADRQVAA